VNLWASNRDEQGALLNSRPHLGKGMISFLISLFHLYSAALVRDFYLDIFRDGNQAIGKTWIIQDLAQATRPCISSHRVKRC